VPSPQEIKPIVEDVPGFLLAIPEILHSLIAANPAGAVLAGLLGALIAGLIARIAHRRTLAAEVRGAQNVSASNAEVSKLEEEQYRALFRPSFARRANGGSSRPMMRHRASMVIRARNC
jgi:hypothetical protein